MNWALDTDFVVSSMLLGDEKSVYKELEPLYRMHSYLCYGKCYIEL